MRTPWKSITRTLCVAALTTVVAQSTHAASVLVDFGDTDAGTNPDFSDGWNVIPSAATIIADAVDSSNNPTGISITITTPFGGTNTNGITDGSGPYQSDATKDSFYGNTSEFGGQTSPQATISIGGLNQALTYDFTFYAARSGSGQIRDTLYALTGANSGSTVLDAYGNVSNTATVFGIRPDAGNTVTLDVSPGPNNNNSFGFYYLGAMEITAVPEPGTAVFLLGSLSLLALRRRR